MSAPPTRPTQEQLDRYAEQFTQSQTLRYLGVRLSFPEGRKVVISLPEVRPEHLGGLGTTAVNGAILSAMFDLAIGCTPALLDPTRRCATLQLSVSFQRPLVGGSVEAEAEIDSYGKSTLFASARIRDAQGNICARAQGVVRISTLPWASGESPAIN
ncbi:PaaI family thioesterase [Stigmatella aurantiaca]|uniref:Phenylacetic acid degradation-related protein n=1 Tax=Stigmatella aurantiaca (strain DW4/3-1) TaxID=378806 RepID=Q09CT3_STIAD|nr:PaaI family thioesterase [Stigmatella aurantiaca]ADO70092.1 Thioesterase family protein [Stigmatella aurantiaca DW4/3-1]EAU69570.1 phenylacetic acid degradation-related protein [Stigmatella aurantiaca DW4/3-1]